MYVFYHRSTASLVILWSLCKQGWW